MHRLLVAAVLLLPAVILARDQCVVVTGKVVCKSDAEAVVMTEILLYDRDGLDPDHAAAFLGALDPDDLMGNTTVDETGKFNVSGCASDFNWIPWQDNGPEPYLVIKHFCGYPNGTLVEVAEIDVFAPEVYDVHEEHGVLVLDDIHERL